MSKSKTPATEPVEEQAVIGQELAREEPGTGPVAEEEQDGVPKLVKVQSLAKSTLRQPSSGWSIESGKVREMLVDGWLENQLKAKLLQKV